MISLFDRMFCFEQEGFDGRFRLFSSMTYFVRVRSTWFNAKSSLPPNTIRIPKKTYTTYTKNVTGNHMATHSFKQKFKFDFLTNTNLTK